MRCVSSYTDNILFKRWWMDNLFAVITNILPNLKSLAHIGSFDLEQMIFSLCSAFELLDDHVSDTNDIYQNIVINTNALIQWTTCSNFVILLLVTVHAL